jgi:AcrR family transcriptional regulator
MALREQKRVAAWRSIHEAAIRLFEQQGYQATTIDQIAAAAGVSRATFFNYFASKEAVVFDQDPEARQQWLHSMKQRPTDEPLWDALTAVLLEFAASLRQRMPLQRRLKALSPALAQSTQDFGDRFAADLRDWVRERDVASPERDEPSSALQLNLALAALSTAYQVGNPEEVFDDFFDRVRRYLRQADPRR